MNRVTVPIGPQHPLLKEPMLVLLSMEGEQVMESALRLGYVHRGIERLCQQRTYVQNLHLIERVCGICSHIHTTTFCQGIERLLEVEAPPRAQYLRTLLCELERVHSHLLWLGVLAKHIGFDTIFMYAWRDREIVLDIMEEISGGRVSHAVNIVGGVRIDIDPAHHDTILRRLDDLQAKIEILQEVVEHETSFRARTQQIGYLSSGDIHRYCVVGPVARASGVDIDMRRDAPYGIYSQLNFKVITRSEGDVWARTLVRIDEVLQSLHLCRQTLDDLPRGEISVRSKRRVPSGEVLVRAEAPRGELVYYIQSDGSEKPTRVKIRTPTLTTLITIPNQLRGLSLADVSVVISGVDMCVSCADR
jgi:Ni,Fe-hydrogenase III large subunit